MLLRIITVHDELTALGIVEKKRKPIDFLEEAAESGNTPDTGIVLFQITTSSANILLLSLTSSLTLSSAS